MLIREDKVVWYNEKRIQTIKIFQNMSDIKKINNLLTDIAKNKSSVILKEDDGIVIIERSKKYTSIEKKDFNNNTIYMYYYGNAYVNTNKGIKEIKNLINTTDLRNIIKCIENIKK